MRLCWTAITQMMEQGIHLKQVQYILVCKKIVTDVGDYNSHVTISISALHSDNFIETSTMSPWFSSKSAKHKILVEAIDISAGW